ncbi:hypothetical protein TSAR_005139 [Trichomalopsis sarcophagae]|uniref:S-adenosylmethionine sensor upstream of mTORC1 n=1 Tax=Trichomalopsis sarcophagae TaxID=543379 RepID=A0A232FE29_9HYME|nr:hypothetical protein TSAR_005139 [Trichomalopsis sarcophagae]
MEEKRGVERKIERKASEKHKQLANFIKEIHTQLRIDSEKYGAEETWKTHITQNDKLNHYAESMYQLATEHWVEKSKTSAPLTYCRVEWIKHQCKEYFFNGGMKKFDDKEVHLLNKDTEELNKIDYSTKIKTTIDSKINVLDVGSCYNPFSSEHLFSVTAIDIAPYSKDVTKCDFLNLNVGNAKIFLESEQALIELPKNSFDAVIFSLLLEYIPSPEQRFLCCQKAYDLLKNGGVLIIATPDSKHMGANTKVINTSWKVVLAKLGFMRIQYEKLPHIHCLVFRKCFYKVAAMKKIDWKKINEEDELFSSGKIFIPQDFHTKLNEESPDTSFKKFEHNDQELVSLFGELPCED